MKIPKRESYEKKDWFENYPKLEVLLAFGVSTDDINRYYNEYFKDKASKDLTDFAKNFYALVIHLHDLLDYEKLAKGQQQKPGALSLGVARHLYNHSLRKILQTKDGGVQVENGIELQPFGATATEQSAEAWNNAMDSAYTLFIALGLVVAIYHLCLHGNSNTAFHWLQSIQQYGGYTWNFIDAVGMYRLGKWHDERDEQRYSNANKRFGGMLALLTTAAIPCDLIHAVPGFIGVGLSGLSFAACMFASMTIELWQLDDCNQRMKAIKAELKNTDLDSTKKHCLLDELLFQQAKADSHRRQAQSWFLCGVAMTVIAVAALLAVSVLTAGIAPAVVIAVGAAMGLVSMSLRMYRNHVMKKNDPLLALTKQSEEGKRSKKIDEFLNKLSSLQDKRLLECKIKRHKIYSFWQPNSETLEKYLLRLCAKDATLAVNVMTEIEKLEKEKIIKPLKIEATNNQGKDVILVLSLYTDSYKLAELEKQQEADNQWRLSGLSLF